MAERILRNGTPQHPVPEIRDGRQLRTGKVQEQLFGTVPWSNHDDDQEVESSLETKMTTETEEKEEKKGPGRKGLDWEMVWSNELGRGEVAQQASGLWTGRVTWATNEKPESRPYQPGKEFASLFVTGLLKERRIKMATPSVTPPAVDSPPPPSPPSMSHPPPPPAAPTEKQEPVKTAPFIPSQVPAGQGQFLKEGIPAGQGQSGLQSGQGPDVAVAPIPEHHTNPVEITKTQVYKAPVAPPATPPVAPPVAPPVISTTRGATLVQEQEDLQVSHAIGLITEGIREFHCVIQLRGRMALLTPTDIELSAKLHRMDLKLQGYKATYKAK